MEIIFHFPVLYFICFMTLLSYTLILFIDFEFQEFLNDGEKTG